MRLKRKGESGLRFPFLRLICYVVAGMLGLGLILYPLLSNSLYDARQDGVLEEYDKDKYATPKHKSHTEMER